MATSPLFDTAISPASMPPPAAEQDGELIPASSGQRRLWFLEQMEPGTPLYNIPYLVRLSGVLDKDALDKSLAALVERHETLRTNFIAVGSEPRQLVRPAAPIDVPLADLTAISEGEREAELRRLTSEEARRPFDLARDPMLRVRLFRLSPTEHALMLVMHHIASDGWSMAVLYRELGLCYEAFSSGHEPQLAALPVQYGDFAQWQEEYLQGETLTRLVDFWRKTMSGAPALLELPSDHPRPPVQSHRGDSLDIRIPGQLIARLRQLSSQNRVTLFMTLLAGFEVLIHRYTGQTDIVLGSPLAGRDAAETEGLIGFFINTLALRTNLSGDPSVTELLERVRNVTLSAYEHREMPYEKLVEELQPKRNLSFDPICQIFFMLQNVPTAPLTLPGIKLSVEPVYTGTSKADLTIWAIEQPDHLGVTVEYSTDLFERTTIERMMGHYVAILEAMAAQPEQKISRLPLLTAPEKGLILGEWNETSVEYPRDATIQSLFSEQVARTPDKIAAVFEDTELTYAELDARAERLAAKLRALGAGADVLVGIFVERSLEMMVGLLGILKAGAAYVPLDPAFPKERLAFMLKDSRAPVLVTQTALLGKLPAHEAAVICADEADGVVPDVPGTAVTQPTGAVAPRRADSSSLAYVLYTSGSTGNPKGVMVTHRNAVNFFAGMDRVVGTEPGVWLAVTSISFDISGLELFWTLTRGFKVVILSESARMPGAGSGDAAVSRAKKPLDFSLFYFGNETEETGGAGRYQLTLDGARFADSHGFKAVWTPERHFHGFGGLYPNPAVLGAAIAATTEKIEIRAGSVVLPLHSPLRVAEEWSVVDNLSNGRVGISVASGWHDRDFALAPANFADRKAIMRRDIETIRHLWAGEAIEFPGGRGNPVAVRVFPKPVQRELPIWVTAAGNPETFRLAGEIGANVLTHFLGQEPEELARKILIYREARRAAGHPGDGCVSIALHTFVGENLDEVRALVHDPLCRYLRESVELLRELSQGLYPGAEVTRLSEEETQAVVEYSFNRYFAACGLLGTADTCRRTLARLADLGVDDIACLIDFGVEPQAVLESLQRLDRIRSEWERVHGRRAAQSGSSQAIRGRVAAEASSFTLPGQIAAHGVTHLQCTPSHARILTQNPESLEALRSIRKLFVGGEALPTGLADELLRVVPGEVVNMYGPTETTIWSTTHRVRPEPSTTGTVAIGSPIANTRIYILDANREPVPVGIPGELWIAGDGVARGYLNRPELTAERFAPAPFAIDDNSVQPPTNAHREDCHRTDDVLGRQEARMYRTGDMARWRADGVVEFLGRADFQVKIRGHRIELGEIEAALMQHSDVRQAVVALRTDVPDDPRLVAYLVPASAGTPQPGSLRDFLKQKLPDYMVPSAYVSLEALPLTPNGKVDRKALPAPQLATADSRKDFVPPAGDVERTLASIWKDILRAENVGADDNFFDFGGHSLQVVQVQNRLRETLQVDVPVLKLFQYPTIRSLAKFLGEAPKDEPSLRQKIEERNRRRLTAIAPRRRPTAGLERS